MTECYENAGRAAAENFQNSTIKLMESTIIEHHQQLGDWAATRLQRRLCLPPA
jgi:hypothetical protein